MPIKQDVKVDDLVFDCLVSGDKESQMVLFLHGFPETSIMWTSLMDEISSEGFYCVAPNMRGYSKNACPKGKRHYTIDKLAQDVIDLMQHYDKDQIHLVGHDWGAVVGWYAVYHNPEKFKSWSALSVPHINAFEKALQKDKSQQKMSKYIKDFQIPFLPELKLRKNNFKLLKKIWNKSSPQEIENYTNIFKQKGSLTAAINYYRANFGRKQLLSIGHIKTPTLFIYGKNDFAIGNYGAERCANYVDGFFKQVTLDAGHWLIQESYNEVKQEVKAHLEKFKKT